MNKKNLKEIRKLIYSNQIEKLSNEISEFYEKNERQIKKWKKIFDKQKEDRLTWLSLVDSKDSDTLEDTKTYVEIAVNAYSSNLEIELLEWYLHDYKDYHDTIDEIQYFTYVVERGLQKKDLDIVAYLLFCVVCLGGKLSTLHNLRGYYAQINKFKNKD